MTSRTSRKTNESGRSARAGAARQTFGEGTSAGTPKHKRVRNGEATRTRILEAALDVFSAHGLGGSAINDIAIHAKVSRPLLLHHFPSKEALWEAVQNQCSVLFMTEYAPRFVHRGHGRAAVVALLQTWLAYFRENPKLQKLGLWTHAHGEVSSWPGELGWMARCLEVLKEAQRANVVRNDIKAIELLTFSFGIIYFWLLNGRRFYNDTRTPLTTMPSDDKLIESILKVMLTRDS